MPKSEFNKRLCESRTPQPVREKLTNPGIRIDPAAETLSGAVVEKFSNGGAVCRAKDGRKLWEKKSPDGPTLYTAKISHADRVNQNDRVYTRKSWTDNIARMKPMLEKGMVKGAVDHLGETEGGNLERSPIIWRDVRMEEDGSVYGDYEIVSAHSAGADLKALKDAGSAIGWSTFGYGTARDASPDECTAYGMKEDDVVMTDVGPGAYQMRKCDAVDDPSCEDAWDTDAASRNAPPVVESKHTAEACSNGLHWIEIGRCGHILSQCRCEDDHKTHTYSEKTCAKCAGLEGLTAAQFVAERMAKPKQVAEGRAPLAKTYAQYIQSKSGDSFEPAGQFKLASALTSDAYRIIETYDGVRFVRFAPQTDELYQFPGSIMESVLKEIDKFWDLKANYDALGLIHNRGVMMHGPPGSGKTSAVNQVADMIICRGDVVFYSRSISALGEALRAFREVEPDRKVVAVLEDADEYIGYQEKAFLNLLDGDESVGGVLYLATTNYLNRFPERLLRPGRFDKKVYVGHPPYEGRKAYLTNKLGKLERAEEIDRLAKQTDGLSFGHLRELVLAVYALKEPVEEVLERLKGGKSAPRNTDNATPRLSTQKVEEKTNPTAGVIEESTMKTLAELKAANPEVFAQHESAVKTASKPVLDAIAKLLDMPGVKESIELPHREVLPAEFHAQLEKANSDKSELQKQVETAKAEVIKVTAEKAELQKVIDAGTAEKADAERLAKVTAKATEFLKDHAAKSLVLDDVNATAKSDKAFDESKVEAFVKTATARAEKYAEAFGKNTVIPGSNIDDEDLDKAEENEHEVATEGSKVEPASELMRK